MGYRGECQDVPWIFIFASRIDIDKRRYQWYHNKAVRKGEEVRYGGYRPEENKKFLYYSPH